MERFTKDINGAKYTVYYTYTEHSDKGLYFNVKIKKATYKELNNFDYRKLLNNCQLANIIENYLCMPIF